MNSVEIWSSLGRHSLALTFALIAILALRQLGTRTLHPHIRYALWLAVPLVFFALHMPKAAVETSVVTAPTQSIPLLAMPAQPGAAAAPTVNWSAALLGIWLLGLLTSLSLLIWRYRQALKQARAGVGSACVIGVIRTRLQLPSDFSERFDAAQQALIIAHERFHIIRRDPLINLITQLLHCVFWFHPLMPMAMRAFRCDQEMSCDAAIVTGQTSLISRYAQTLAEHADDAKTPLLWCHWQPTHPLLERISMLKNVQQKTFKPWLGRILLSTVLATASWLSFALAPVETAASNYWIAAQVTRDNQTIANAVAIRVPAGHEGSIEVGQNTRNTSAQSVRVKPELSITVQPNSDGQSTKVAVQTVLQSSNGAGEFVEHFELALNDAENSTFKLINPETKQVYQITLNARPARPNDELPTVPGYPKAAWVLGITGKVVLNVGLDADGHVQQTEILKSEPQGVFDQAAIAGAKSRTYGATSVPAGEKLAWVEVPFVFKLEN